MLALTCWYTVSTRNQAFEQQLEPWRTLELRKLPPFQSFSLVTKSILNGSALYPNRVNRVAEKRNITNPHRLDIKAVTFTYSVANFEVSVALNVDVDELLIGIIAQVKDAFLSNENNEGSQIIHPNVSPFIFPLYSLCL